MPTRRSIQRDQVYRQLRPMLLHGQLQPGMRLGEAEWAEKLGVHRGALREVFGLLAHEGLLRPGKRGGHFVPAVERADLDDVLELRAALEVGALRRLGRLNQTIDVAPLRAACETTRLMIDRRMKLGFVESDRRFHEQLIELAGNTRMTRAYHQAPVLMPLNFEEPCPMNLDTMRQTLAEHETICDLLDAGRFNAAADALEQHLFSAHSTVFVPLQFELSSSH